MLTKLLFYVIPIHVDVTSVDMRIYEHFLNLKFPDCTVINCMQEWF